MRLSVFLTAGILITAVGLVLSSWTLHAGAEKAPASTETLPLLAQGGKNDEPRIVTDRRNNAVVVLVHGKEVLRIDATGLHVNGDIDYTGEIKDAGHGGAYP